MGVPRLSVVCLAAVWCAVAQAGDPALDEQVSTLAAELLSTDAKVRRHADDELRKIGVEAIPQLLRCAGLNVGSKTWSAAVAVLGEIDAADALSEVDSCRTEWRANGWLTESGKGEGRRVVDELREQLLQFRKDQWSAPSALEPATLEDPFRLPPWAAIRIGDRLPRDLVWADVPVRGTPEELEIDVTGNGKFRLKVASAEPQVVEIGKRAQARRVLVFSRAGRWWAASPNLLRGSVAGTDVEALDVQGDGDFGGPGDLIRFGDGAFRPVGETEFAWSATGLVRFRLRRAREGWTCSFLPEPEPHWVDEPTRQTLAALSRWRNAAGLGPQRIDRERSRCCSLHHRYWLRQGFSFGGEDVNSEDYTDDGERASDASTAWPSADGWALVRGIAATVLHRASLVGATREGVGCIATNEGSLLWGGTIDTQDRPGPLLVPGPGQVAVPRECSQEFPRPVRDVEFYARPRGFPVSVTRSGIGTRRVAGSRIEVFEAGTTTAVAGTTFSWEQPYDPAFPWNWDDDSVVFVADEPLRPASVYTARYTEPDDAAPVELVWQFRTQ